jgi:hypothetical protein
MNANSLMAIGGGFILLLAISIGRQRYLHETYALTWVGIGMALLVSALFPCDGLLSAWDLSEVTKVVLIGMAALFLFSFTVSISLTHQYRRNVLLNQEMALLEFRLRNLEDACASRWKRRDRERLVMEKGLAAKLAGAGTYQGRH